MASRIFWVLLSGAALIAGIAIQDGGSIISLASESDRQASIEERVDRAIDRSVDKIDMEVVTVDGREIRVSPEQKDAMANAIGRLAKAEAHLVALKVRRADDQEIAAASTERDQARTEIEQIKAQMVEGRDAAKDGDAIRRQVRDEVRESIRDAVRS